MPKIGIDINSTCGNITGVGVYTRHIVENLKSSSGYEFCLHSPTRPIKSTLERLWWENITLPNLAQRDKIDLLHVPAFAPPIKKKCPLIVTVHDLIGIQFKNQLGAVSRFYWKNWLPQAAKSADFIISDSEYTKNDICKLLNYPEDRIRVIYPSGHEGFTRSITAAEKNRIKRLKGVSGRYFVFVGTLEPRKNIQTAFEAFSRFLSLTDQPDEFHFVIIGSKSFAKGRYYEDLIKRFRVPAGRIVFTGYVSHEELNVLYAGSEALVFPSRYEGFGIPPLEAMASGTAVICSNAASIPEVVGTASALHSPDDYEGFAQSMMRISSDTIFRQDLISRGYERLQHFSWKKTAAMIIDTYKELLNRRI